jgi:hypothetical protein
MPYLFACHRESVLLTLPVTFLGEHQRLIRASMAHRWAKAAFHCRNALHMRRAVVSLAYALKWDTEWTRRTKLIWAFSRGKKKIPNSFDLGAYKSVAWRRS